jgi:hypothetical protein
MWKHFIRNNSSYSCSIVEANVTFKLNLFFFNLHIAQLQRSFAAEDFHHHFQLLLLFVYFFDHTSKGVKRTINYFNSFSDIELINDRFFGFGEFIDFTKNAVHFSQSQWYRFSGF